MATVSRLAVFWRVFFAALIGGTAAGAAGPEETNAWNAAVAANTPEGYYLYLSLYPAGEYVDQAIDALGLLGSAGAPRQVAPVPPAVDPPAQTGSGDRAGNGAGMY